MAKKKAAQIGFHLITIFPDYLASTLKEGVVSRALEQGLISYDATQLRAFAGNKHGSIDDRPYGGGPGMLMKAEPLRDAVIAIGKKIKKGFNALSKSERKKNKTLLVSFSPAGSAFDHAKAKAVAKKYRHVVFLCGRYEGIDHRMEEAVDERWSVGPYVLSGGELAAAVCMDAISRFVPGTLGNGESLTEETEGDAGEYPHYTRPETVVINGKKKKVPAALLSGNHAEIKRWREANR